MIRLALLLLLLPACSAPPNATEDASISVEDGGAIGDLTRSLPEAAIDAGHARPDLTPDLSTRDLATADLATRDLATPDLATPDLATPDLATPDLASPDLATGTGNIELKVTIRADQVDLAMQQFALDKAAAERRWIYFYDTKPLALYPAGLILRARKVKGGSDDSTVKLRPLEPGGVAPKWLVVPGWKCEIDKVGPIATSSCSLSVDQVAGEIDDVAAGKRTIDKLYSNEQEQLIAEHAKMQPDWKALAVLGPTDAWVWKLTPMGFPQGVAAERWELPGGKTLLELSTRVPLAEGKAVEAQLKALLQGKGLDTTSDQETKTTAALEFWAAK